MIWSRETRWGSTLKFVEFSLTLKICSKIVQIFVQMHHLGCVWNHRVTCLKELLMSSQLSLTFASGSASEGKTSIVCQLYHYLPFPLHWVIRKWHSSTGVGSVNNRRCWALQFKSRVRTMPISNLHLQRVVLNYCLFLHMLLQQACVYRFFLQG